MSEQKTSIEIIAASIEEAIEQGLAELGLSEEDVDIDILDSGSRGLFGLGSRQARVRLSVRTPGEEGASVSPNSLKPGEAPEEVEDFEEEFDQAALMEELQAKPTDVYQPDQDELLRVAAVVVEDLLLRLKVNARVSAKMVQADDEQRKATVWVDVNGSDLSILIGPRAETLNALQYIAGLIASKELGRNIPLVVDVEGFRARRIQQLCQLARRMADQAIKTGRRQVLEPMPASERRIIHIELRNNPQVTTESVGEEPRRKVTIIPK
jgi:spoIIIJ-associated protein